MPRGFYLSCSQEEFLLPTGMWGLHLDEQQ